MFSVEELKEAKLQKKDSKDKKEESYEPVKITFEEDWMSKALSGIELKEKIDFDFLTETVQFV